MGSMTAASPTENQPSEEAEVVLLIDELSANPHVYGLRCDPTELIWPRYAFTDPGPYTVQRFTGAREEIPLPKVGGATIEGTSGTTDAIGLGIDYDGVVPVEAFATLWLLSALHSDVLGTILVFNPLKVDSAYAG